MGPPLNSQTMREFRKWWSWFVVTNGNKLQHKYNEEGNTSGIERNYDTCSKIYE